MIKSGPTILNHLTEREYEKIRGGPGAPLRNGFVDDASEGLHWTRSPSPQGNIDYAALIEDRLLVIRDI